MLDVAAKITDETPQVLKKARAGFVTSLARAGAYVRGVAKRMIKVSDQPSMPGKPPRSRKGKLKNAIFFAVEKDVQDVVIGPSSGEAGKIGHTHEFSGIEAPKKAPVLRQNNWILRVGGHGPLRIENDTVYVGKLRTLKQVALAKSLAPAAVELSHFKYLDALMNYWTTGASKPRKYPARPFMGPALLIAKDRLPPLWANSIKGG